MLIEKVVYFGVVGSFGFGFGFGFGLETV